MTLDDLAFDRRHIWHPYTSMTSPLPVYPVVSAHGCELSLAGGEQLVDGMSSWWAAIHGYNHPRLNAALKGQIDQMSHVMFGGITHPPAVALCRQLVAMTPASLECVFLADSGSVAVEVAMKMALQYWQAKGEPRRRFLTFRNGYHGDTFGAMSVCDPQNSMHSLWQGYLPDNLFAPAPQSRFDGEWDEMDMVPFARLMAAHRHEIAAVILEPIVQGAGGMRMYDVSFLKKARELCDQYGVLLVFDEVATGFGRTGNRFVADLVLPDILVLGKALTGGYIGHAATVANRKVFEGFYDDVPEHALMHGPTFMGNALACSAALASIELFETQNYMEKIKRIEAVTRREMKGFTDPRIREVRIMGGCVCVEVYDPAVLKGYQEYAYKRGVFSRPFLNYLYAMVPYVIQEDELVQVLQCMKDWFAR